MRCLLQVKNVDNALVWNLFGRHYFRLAFKREEADNLGSQNDRNAAVQTAGNTFLKQKHVHKLLKSNKTLSYNNLLEANKIVHVPVLLPVEQQQTVV